MADMMCPNCGTRRMAVLEGSGIEVSLGWCFSCLNDHYDKHHKDDADDTAPVASEPAAERVASSGYIADHVASGDVESMKAIIQQQQAEIAALKKQLDAAQDVNTAAVILVAQQAANLDSMRSERDALAAALMRISTVDEVVDMDAFTNWTPDQKAAQLFLYVQSIAALTLKKLAVDNVNVSRER